MKFRSSLLLILLSLVLIYCTKQTEEIDGAVLPERLTELLPLQKGKYIIYRLDSLVFTKLGTDREIHRYTVKYQVDTTFLDNQGNVSYRIYRYLNDSTAKGPWIPAGTAYITPFSNRIEKVEDNLRSIILAAPVREGFTWKGNRYLTDYPFGLEFTNMPNWEFMYGAEMDEEIEGRTIENVRTVYKANELTNALYDRPIVDTQLAMNITSVAKYARNIGLVYEENTLWEHQNRFSIEIDPVTRDTIKTYTPYSLGFGVRMWMIDHN